MKKIKNNPICFRVLATSLLFSLSLMLLGCPSNNSAGGGATLTGTELALKVFSQAPKPAGTGPALEVLSEASDTSAAAISAKGTTIPLAWTDPAADDYTHVRIAWTTTPASSTAADSVDVAKGTGTATITGLRSDVEYTFTSRLVAGTGDSQITSDPSAELKASPALRVAMFSLGRQTADFGFDACQTALDSSSATDLGAQIKAAGYTKAIFFGSTPDYNFTELHGDTDALGDIASSLPTAERTGTTLANVQENRSLILFAQDGAGDLLPRRTFGSPGVARTIGNVAGVFTGCPTDATGCTAQAGGAWQNGGADVMAAAGVRVPIDNLELKNRFWSMTYVISGDTKTYPSGSSCAEATATTGFGVVGDYRAVDSLPTSGAQTFSCSNNALVLCVAR